MTAAFFFSVLNGGLAVLVFAYLARAFFLHRSGKRFSGIGPAASVRVCWGVLGAAAIAFLMIVGVVLLFVLPEGEAHDVAFGILNIAYLLILGGVYMKIEMATRNEHVRAERMRTDAQVSARRERLKEAFGGKPIDRDEVKYILGEAVLEVLRLWEEWSNATATPKEKELHKSENGETKGGD